jgi:hypothetical protein
MKMKPAFADLREEFPNLSWRSINILEDPEGITQKYGIKQIPALAVVSDKGVAKACGTNITEYYRILKQSGQ